MGRGAWLAKRICPCFEITFIETQGAHMVSVHPPHDLYRYVAIVVALCTWGGRHYTKTARDPGAMRVSAPGGRHPRRHPHRHSHTPAQTHTQTPAHTPAQTLAQTPAQTRGQGTGAACSDTVRTVWSACRHPVAMRFFITSPLYDVDTVPAELSTTLAWCQGLTLVHLSAQLERFVWDRGCA